MTQSTAPLWLALELSVREVTASDRAKIARTRDIATGTTSARMNFFINVRFFSPKKVRGQTEGCRVQLSVVYRLTFKWPSIFA